MEEECTPLPEQLEELLKEHYEISDEAALALAQWGHALLVPVIADAARVDSQLSSALVLPPNVVTSIDIGRALRPHVFLPPSKPPVWVIPSCGDGSCLLTSLRICLDLAASTLEALSVLDGNAPRGTPELSGAMNSPNHRDNHRIRKACVAWYASNLNSPINDTVQYEEKTPEGETVLKSRPMTRGDFIVMQMSESVRGDVDMSPAFSEKRNAMAASYLAQLSEDRAWGSLPVIMAFANILTVPRGIRVYQVISGRLQSLCQDVVPALALPLPSNDDDDILSVPSPPEIHDISADDATLWENSIEDDEPSEEELEDEEQEDEKPIHQIFFRLLYHAGGHYDVLATDMQKRLICAAFPSVAQEFKPLY